MSRVVHLFLLGVGVALAAVVVWKAGPAALWQTIASLGPGLGLVILLDGVGDVFHAAGTLPCFGSGQRRPPFINMLYIRLAGRAYSYFTPTSGFGGDVLKVLLLRRYASTHDATTVIIIDKFTFGVAQFSMAFAGSAAVIAVLDLPAHVKWAFFTISALLWAGFAGFLVFQRQGWLKKVLTFVTGIVGVRRGAGLARHLGEIDQRLQLYYRGQRSDVLRSMLFHSAGFVTDIVATWLFLDLALHTRSWSIAAAVWSLSTWFDAMVFLVPLGLGTQESIRALVFRALGFPWDNGVAYALVLRMAQILWGAVGLGTHAIETAGGRRRAVDEPEGAGSPLDGINVTSRRGVGSAAYDDRSPDLDSPGPLEPTSNRTSTDADRPGGTRRAHR